ncbi:hypothetical protein FSP39_012490 [Pinctada imbricata]|uniref:Cyclic nucleotide-binding domain-containing protein n=1 Tax=Pinctada imbricata TaxID=66713 RepID=A0AA88YMI2_PINIB|nr:hypothetical protein FSP39_012490 [Pinctada imbricata]
MSSSVRLRKYSDSSIILERNYIRDDDFAVDKLETSSKLFDIPENHDTRRGRRIHSESDFCRRKYSDTYINQTYRSRRRSDSDYSRRLSSVSQDSYRGPRRPSQNDGIDLTQARRQQTRPKQRAEMNFQDNFYNLSLSRSKLTKTNSTQNFQSLSSLRKLYRRPSKEKGVGKLLRRVRSESNVIPAPWKNRILPLVRFRRAVKTIQVLLKATLTNTQGQRNDGLLSWAHDDVSTSKREYEMFGLSFDPGDYRAKKEFHSLYTDFPILTFGFFYQQSAVVTILQRDDESGEQVVRTAAVLKKGNSFGELALMHGAKRSATVTCKNSVELLAVGREDFVDIFMPMDKDQEPEHIRFLRSIQLLGGWPIERLPYHDTKICCFTYFRRGLLLCKDSNSSEWVYIIKTGTCRVLKALHVVKPQIPSPTWSTAKAKNLLKLPPISPSLKSSQSLTTSISSDSSPRSTGSLYELVPKRRKCNAEALSNILHKPYPSDEVLSLDHQRLLDEIMLNVLFLPYLDEVLSLDHQRLLDEIYTEKHAFTTRWGKRLPKLQPPESSKQHKPETVYVQIQKLGPRETYGVEQVAFGRIGRTTSTILVSEGAECILINRKFFQQYLSDEEAKRIRRTLQPIPTDESLQQKLQDKTNWEAYKAITVVNHMIHRKPYYSDDTSYH